MTAPENALAPQPRPVRAEQPPPEVARGGDRYAALDALRGLAALVVVVGHVLVLDPRLADVLAPRPRPAHGVAALLVHSPLHLLWAGGEAVVVFFVLSGFVLALPAASGRPPSWRAYYPRRFVRLYVPALVALGLALPQAFWLRPDGKPGSSWWYRTHVDALTPVQAVHDAVLLLGTGQIMTVLWSLQWELLFSLALPAFLLLLRLRRPTSGVVVSAALLLAVVLAPVLGHASAAHLPAFAAGVLVCRVRAQVAALARRRGTPMLVGALLLLWLPWGWRAVVPGPAVVGGLAGAVTLAGAVLLVAALLDGPAARALGRSRGAAWSGRRSFSLYLVHEPLVVSLAAVLGTRPPVLVVLVLALPLALLAAEAFGRLVEEPSQQLARRAGALLPAATR